MDHATQFAGTPADFGTRHDIKNNPEVQKWISLGHWPGISPDHGNGVAEAIRLLALGSIAAGIGWRLLAARNMCQGADHTVKIG